LLKYIGKIAAVVAAAAGLTLLLMFLAGFFHRKVVTDQVKASVHDLSNVTLAAVRLIQKPRYETAVGTIKAVDEAAIASRLLARVIEVNVKAAQAVQRDDVLLRLDDKDLQARHKQAEAARESAKATFDNASAEYERAKRLLSTKAIALQEYDRAT